VGLYIKPSKLEEQLVSYWIDILGMRDKKDTYFVDLSIGEQCLVMTARAMVKNPKLLILDEPTAGLDQQSNELFMKLVNTIAKQHHTAIIYVSHKREVKLTADFVMELIPKSDGSTYQQL
jgi:molybdate transport system ATP-binding protein